MGGTEGRTSDANEDLSNETDQVLLREGEGAGGAGGVGSVEGGGVGLRWGWGDSKSFLGDRARGEVEEAGVWGSGRGEGHARGGGSLLDKGDGLEEE